MDSPTRSCPARSSGEKREPGASQLPAARRARGGRGRPRCPRPFPALSPPTSLSGLGGPARATSRGGDERGGARRRRGGRGSHARAPPRPEPAPGCPPLLGPAAGVSGSGGRGAAARPAMSPLFSWVAKVGGFGAASGGRSLPAGMALGAAVPAGAVLGTFVTVGPLGVRSAVSAQGWEVRLSLGRARRGRRAIPGSRRESNWCEARVVSQVVLIH